MPGSRGSAGGVRRRVLTGVLATVAAGLLGVVPQLAAREPQAAAAPGPGQQAAAFRLGGDTGPRTVLRYRGRIEGRTVADSSAAGNHGLIRTGDGGRLNAAGTRSRPFLRFTARDCGSRAGCARAAVVPDRALTPGEDGRGSFAFGAWVRLTAEPGNTGMTVIQRGGTDPGSPQWSLRVDDGRVSCRWSDGERTAVLPDDLGASAPLRLRRWYAISCARKHSRVSLTVSDPISSLPVGTWSTRVPGLGAIRPRGPATIGATPAGERGGGKLVAQFRGDLDEVVFRTAP